MLRVKHLGSRKHLQESIWILIQNPMTQVEGLGRTPTSGADPRATWATSRDSSGAGHGLDDSVFSFFDSRVLPAPPAQEVRACVLDAERCLSAVPAYHCPSCGDFHEGDTRIIASEPSGSTHCYFPVIPVCAGERNGLPRAKADDN